MRYTKIKIQRQKSWDRNVIRFYNKKELVGMNFYQGVTDDDNIDKHWMEPDESLFRIYLNYNSRYHNEWSFKKILNKSIEAYLFANNEMFN